MSPNMYRWIRGTESRCGQEGSMGWPRFGLHENWLVAGGEESGRSNGQSLLYGFVLRTIIPWNISCASAHPLLISRRGIGY